MQKQENHPDRRHHIPMVKMCWQQRAVTTLIVTLITGQLGLGVKNHLHGEENTKEIERTKISIEEKVQRMSEQCVELKANIEELKRNSDRTEKITSNLDRKLDRLIERK